MARQVSGGQGDVFQTFFAHREPLTQSQVSMVRAAPEEQRKFLEAQFMLENESQLVEELTKRLRAESEMSILRNLL